MARLFGVVLPTFGAAGAGGALAGTGQAGGYPTWEYAVLAAVLAATAFAVTACCRRMASPFRP